MKVEENGIIVDFPDDNGFQFGKCPSYRQISGQSVKEMDVCWFDIHANTLWSVELKAFINPANLRHQNTDLSEASTLDEKIEELYTKTIHTLCMIETNRSNTKNCIVPGINNATEFKLIHLINVIPGQETYLQFMKDKLKSMLEPYLAIYRVSTFSVIPYSIARNGALLPWII